MLLAAASLHAADPLPEAFSCGKQGSVGGLGSGTDLVRHVVDTGTFPRAVCNDGTPAVFYYGAATKVEDRNHWIIFLQGGGTCIDGQTRRLPRFRSEEQVRLVEPGAHLLLQVGRVDRRRGADPHRERRRRDARAMRSSPRERESSTRCSTRSAAPARGGGGGRCAMGQGRL